MEANGADKVMISSGDVADCSETTVEIKIKTLDSQTYTLRVNKCMPVPALKEQIASVTGVLSEQQRLICRGKVLKDDQLLSAYHVEDGHTLHLVVRQPLHSSSSSTTGVVGSETAPDHPADDPSNTIRSRGNHVAHSVVLGTFNIADQGEGIMPDMNRIVSAVLSSIGISNFGTGGEGLDLREHGLESLDRTSGASATPSSTQLPTDPVVLQAQSDPMHGAFRFPSAVSVGPLQPTVIPDSLTTMSQYLSHMRHEFSGNGRSHGNVAEASGINGMEGQNSEQGLPTPASLAEIMLSTRQMLIEQAGECLSQVATQLEDQASMTDPLMRTSLQSTTMRSGILMQNLGALLLELGRATMTLRMGRMPSEAVVNAGPAVFISTSGPNPIMVQPLPFQPGTSFGAIHSGAVQPGNGLAGGILGSGVIPRNIDIRIRTGRSMPATNANQGEQAGAQQPSGQPGPTTSAGANLPHQAVPGVSGGSSFTVESGVRVVPVRTVVAAVPAALRRPPTDAAGSAVGLFYPLLARFQHLNPGQSSDTRNPQSSGGSHPAGPATPQQPTPEPAAVNQQNLGSNGASARRDGDSQIANCLSTNDDSVASDIDPSANTSAQHQQGSAPNSNSSEQETSGNNNRNTQANVVQENVREYITQIPSRFDQFLRTIFPGEQIHLSDINFQGTGGGSVAEQREPSTDAEPNQASGVGNDQGVFFSGLVRQIMPFISEATATENAPSARTDGSAPSTSQDERESSAYPGNSPRRDPPSPPDSKRQKRE